MPRFSIRNPYFIIVCCLALAVLAATSFTQMPVDFIPAHQHAGSNRRDLL
jgi:multidrug efflux pump subunit AcrB